MKKYSLKMKQNFAKLSVTEKISRARFIVDSVMNNGPLFPNPVPALNVIANAINDLELAWTEAEDGGKNKKAVMRHKADDLTKYIYDLSYYVYQTANGDEAVMTAAGFEIKKKPSMSVPEFSAEPAGEKGTVRLRVKPRAKPKTVYKWEFTKGSLDKPVWELAKITSNARTRISDLEEGVRYWFRVSYLGGDGGEAKPYEAVSLIVT
jgi:hypothetical protein